MKPTKFVSTILLAAAALFGGPVLSAQTQTAKAELLLSLTVYDNATGGATDGVADGHQSNAPSFSTGKLNDGSYSRLERGVLVFGLPPIPSGKRLVSATLRLHVRASGKDGEAVLYHSQQQNRKTGHNDFYSDPTYLEVAGIAATPSMNAGNDHPAPVELDVTRWVLTDYHHDAGPVVSSFRIQIDDLVFTPTPGNNRYSFFGKTAPNKDHVPELVLAFSDR